MKAISVLLFTLIVGLSADCSGYLYTTGSVLNKVPSNTTVRACVDTGIVETYDTTGSLPLNGFGRPFLEQDLATFLTRTKTPTSSFFSFSQLNLTSKQVITRPTKFQSDIQHYYWEKFFIDRPRNLIVVIGSYGMSKILGGGSPFVLQIALNDLSLISNSSIGVSTWLPIGPYNYDLKRGVVSWIGSDIGELFSARIGLISFDYTTNQASSILFSTKEIWYSNEIIALEQDPTNKNSLLGYDKLYNYVWRFDLNSRNSTKIGSIRPSGGGIQFPGDCASGLGGDAVVFCVLSDLQSFLPVSIGILNLRDLTTQSVPLTGDFGFGPFYVPRSLM